MIPIDSAPSRPCSIGAVALLAVLPLGLGLAVALALGGCSGDGRSPGAEAESSQPAPGTAEIVDKAAADTPSGEPRASAPERGSGETRRLLFDAKGRRMQVTRMPAGARTQDEARQSAQALLSNLLDREAGNPENAWALAHGILARGRDFRANDGRRAVAVLVDDFMKGDAVPGARGIQPYFPKMEGEVRVEPHTDLILKTLIEAGLPLDEPLTDRMGAPTLERLLRSSRLRFQPAGTGSTGLFAEPDDAPWSVQAWCQAVDKGATPAWRTAAGRALNISQVAGDLLATLEREYAFLAEAKARGETVEKRRQHIFRFACGGAHLFQGVVACAATGQPSDPELQARIGGLLDLYLFRIPLETSLVDSGMRQAPGMAPILLNQDVKFLGHALEGLSIAQQRGLWTPTSDEQATLDLAESRLVFHIHELSRMGAYEAERMQRLQRTDGGFQFYLDLIGDAAHAYRGMGLRDELKGRQPPP